MAYDRDKVNLRSLQEGEHLIYVARFHWLCSVSAWLNAILFSWFFGYGLQSLLNFVIRKASTEIAITDRRVIFKRGWADLHTDQVNIDRIEGSVVNQTMMGRILDYGQVIVRGTGIGEIDLPFLMDKPNDFRRALDEARDRYVLKGNRPLTGN
jgi:hypothetical protein